MLIKNLFFYLGALFFGLIGCICDAQKLAHSAEFTDTTSAIHGAEFIHIQKGAEIYVVSEGTAKRITPVKSTHSEQQHKKIEANAPAISQSQNEEESVDSPIVDINFTTVPGDHDFAASSLHRSRISILLSTQNIKFLTALLIVIISGFIYSSLFSKVGKEVLSRLSKFLSGYLFCRPPPALYKLRFFT